MSAGGSSNAWDAETAFRELGEALKRRAPRTFDIPWESLRESAVLAPLQVFEGRPRILFTQRPQTLRHHAGQISFPGGARDPGDRGAIDTALRELEEELGVPAQAVQVLGGLEEIPTPSGFRIAPFVGVLDAWVPLIPNPAEVELLIAVDVAELFLPGRPRIEQRQVAGRGWEVYFYETGPHVIWGATAHILRGLLEEMALLPSWQRWTHV